MNLPPLSLKQVRMEVGIAIVMQRHLIVTMH